ncbi:MAG: ZIP family metal transporter [Planctomycetota bacterium]
MIDEALMTTLMWAVLAGLAASVACGVGAVPVFIPGLDPSKHRGLGYAFAGGLMFAASVYNLILPGMAMTGDGWALGSILPVLVGLLLGAGFLAVVDRYLDAHEKLGEMAERGGWGGRVGLLVFIAMTVHSIPEGVAVGTGFTSDAKHAASAAASIDLSGVQANLGPTLALAIGIHNIPEGLAVAIPLRSAGASFAKCFLAAFLTSLPQPIAAIPAVLLAWVFEPIMPALMGFAAGAMIFLVMLELIPDALEEEKPAPTAWAFTLGFAAMLLIQVLL